MLFALCISNNDFHWKYFSLDRYIYSPYVFETIMTSSTGKRPIIRNVICKSEMLLLQTACAHCPSCFQRLMNSLLMTRLFMCPLMLETAKGRMDSQEVISLTSSIFRSIRGIDSESYNLVGEAIKILAGESKEGSLCVRIPLFAFLSMAETVGVGSNSSDPK